MLNEMSGVKLKYKNTNTTTSHLNTYQGEPIRKSICQELKVFYLLSSTINTHKDC